MPHVLDSLLSAFRETAAGRPDRRDGRNKCYEVSDAAGCAPACFFTQCESFLAFQRRMERDGSRCNCRTLFGAGRIPCDNRIRNLLDDPDPAACDPLFRPCLETVAAQGALAPFQRLDGRLPAAPDGVRFHRSDRVHCPQCSVRRAGSERRQHHFHAMAVGHRGGRRPRHRPAADARVRVPAAGRGRDPRRHERGRAQAGLRAQRRQALARRARRLAAGLPPRPAGRRPVLSATASAPAPAASSPVSRSPRTTRSGSRGPAGRAGRSRTRASTAWRGTAATSSATSGTARKGWPTCRPCRTCSPSRSTPCCSASGAVRLRAVAAVPAPAGHAPRPVPGAAGRAALVPLPGPADAAGGGARRTRASGLPGGRGLDSAQFRAGSVRPAAGRQSRLPPECVRSRARHSADPRRGPRHGPARRPTLPRGGLRSATSRSTCSPHPPKQRSRTPLTAKFRTAGVKTKSRWSFMVATLLRLIMTK